MGALAGLGFLRCVASHANLILVEFNLARPGRRNSHNLSIGVGLLSLSRTIPPPSLQSPRTGAMLRCGQKCARDNAALAVEPGCASDSKPASPPQLPRHCGRL